MDARIVGAKSEPYWKQIEITLRLFDLTTGADAPTIADFYDVFGSDNEAEISLILAQHFGSTKDSTPAMVEFVNEQLGKARAHKSRVLECLRAERPEIFASKRKRQVEFPPQREGDVIKVRVFVDKYVVTIEFVVSEPFVETFHISDGRSFNDMLETCARKRDGDAHGK